MKGLALLGSTGSIGTNVLRIVDAFPDRFGVVGLAAGRNVERLADQVAPIEGVALSQRPAVNSVFARMARPTVAALESWSFFYRWDDDPADSTVEVRWMTNFSTTEDDVDRFAAGVAAAAG